MSRTELIAKAVRKGIAAAIRKNGENGDLGAAVLPGIRAALAADPKVEGSDAALFYGTADPVYYREIGLARPLVRVSDGAPLVSGGKVSKASLVAAVKARRDAGGRLGRWNVLAASATAALGRTVSERETKALYAASGRDLAESYTGRGTRAGATATREDAATAIPTDA